MPEIEIRNGRVIGFSVCGPIDGFPVIAFHGTPGSGKSLTTRASNDAAHALNVRLVAPDRPGYGKSSSHRGHRLTDWPPVVAMVADRLGLAEFSVLGVSGGGPYAAACAALLPERVRRAAIVSGVGPLSETAEKMSGINRVNTRLATLPVNLSRPVSAVTCLAMRRWPEASMRSAAKSMPPCDGEVMLRPDVFENFVDDARTSSKSTAAGMADDYAAFAKSWQFSLEDIRVPVHVWHGDLDVNVPVQHGRDQARRIPGAVFHECPGEGHLLAIDHFSEILASLTETGE